MTLHYTTFQKKMVDDNNVCYTTYPDLIIENLIAQSASYNETSHYVA